MFFSKSSRGYPWVDEFPFIGQQYPPPFQMAGVVSGIRLSMVE
jgi:hypothetical protein